MKCPIGIVGYFQSQLKNKENRGSIEEATIMKPRAIERSNSEPIKEQGVEAFKGVRD